MKNPVVFLEILGSNNTTQNNQSSGIIGNLLGSNTNTQSTSLVGNLLGTNNATSTNNDSIPTTIAKIAVENKDTIITCRVGLNRSLRY